MNAEELYEEILYGIYHNVECNTLNDDIEKRRISQSALYNYVRNVFNMENVRHDKILAAVAQKKPPDMRLNVEIINVQELETKEPTDPNRLWNLFVTTYIGSTPSQQYSTRIQTTPNSAWEKPFSLPLPNGMNHEHLMIEVWHFKPTKNPSENMSNMLEVKNARAWAKLVKQIILKESKRKHELIGRCNIPLETISTSTCELFNLKRKEKQRGSIELRLSFSAVKNNRFAIQEHNQLLQIMLLHELNGLKMDAWCWSGDFSGLGEEIIENHAAQCGLSENTQMLAQWMAYTTIHTDHALSFELLENRLMKVLPFLHPTGTNLKEEQLFWNGVKNVLPSCFSVIRNIQGTSAAMNQLTKVLSILSTVANLSPPKDSNLFPKKVYGWVDKSHTDSKDVDIYDIIEAAIRTRAQDYLFQINTFRTDHQENIEENLEKIIEVLRLIEVDLQQGYQLYNKLFKETVQCQYTSICYIQYDKEMAKYFKMDIERACEHLKRVSMLENPHDELQHQQMTKIGTALFNVYLSMRRTAERNTNYCNEIIDFKINECHEWFRSGVPHWINMHYCCTRNHIKKAIELDQLNAVHETVALSTSAVDTIDTLNPIKIFWHELNWPDIEVSYIFGLKIVDDICRCCVYYADKMSMRITNFEDVHDGCYDTEFIVTQEWCLAINDIDYIGQQLRFFIDELKLNETLTKFTEYRSLAEAQRIKDALNQLIDSTVATIKEKTLQLIQIIVNKMCSTMRMFLMDRDGCTDNGSMERLMMYLDKSLETLHSKFNANHFERIFLAIWDELAIIFHDFIQINLNKQHPPEYFMYLRNCMQVIIMSFTFGDTVRNRIEKETLADIMRLLQLQSLDTSQLIHQYYVTRYEKQQASNDTTYGQLTIRGRITDNELNVEIMNARNLVPISSNGSCHPFVQIQISPSKWKKHHKTMKYRTNVQNNTLFPLFDETFTIKLDDMQKMAENAVIMFSIKDQDLFGLSNKCIAECFITFEHIARNSRMEQIHLKLSRPTSSDCEYINALKWRADDKLAKKFIKQIKRRFSLS